jgi:hypothetical protein
MIAQKQMQSLLKPKSPITTEKDNLKWKASIYIVSPKRTGSVDNNNNLVVSTKGKKKKQKKGSYGYKLAKLEDEDQYCVVKIFIPGRSEYTRTKIKDFEGLEKLGYNGSFYEPSGEKDEMYLDTFYEN